MRAPAYYRALWDSMVILPEWQDRVDAAAALVRKGACQYSGFGVPWEFIGVIHHMECGCNFDRQILTGEKWNLATTLHPEGKGPWRDWRHSTDEALRHRPLRTLADIEAWNGWGYYNRGKDSPYLWSGSNHGEGVGKYVADGKYDPRAESKQVGAAVILFALNWWKPVV